MKLKNAVVLRPMNLRIPAFDLIFLYYLYLY
jgi:hypothetical protein